MLWIWPLVTLVAVAVVAFFVSAELAESTLGRVERTISCPGDGNEATVLFQSDFFEPGRYRSVVACTRFPAGQRPTCSLACLGLSKAAIASQGSPRVPVLHG